MITWRSRLGSGSVGTCDDETGAGGPEPPPKPLDRRRPLDEHARVPGRQVEVVAGGHGRHATPLEQTSELAGGREGSRGVAVAFRTSPSRTTPSRESSYTHVLADETELDYASLV